MLEELRQAHYRNIPALAQQLARRDIDSYCPPSRGSVALGFQFFNVLNHPNFGTPVNSSSDPAYGLIFYGEQVPTGMLGSGNNGSGRMVQLKAELRF